MRFVQVLLADGKVKNYDGPDYRAKLQVKLRALARANKPLPFTVAQAKRLPLTDLVRMDNEWSQGNNGGTHAMVVET